MTLVLTFRPLGFFLAVLFVLADDFRLFMIVALEDDLFGSWPIQTWRRRVAHLFCILIPPALTFVLTFRVLGFLVGLLFAFAADFALFMTGSPWNMTHLTATDSVSQIRITPRRPLQAVTGSQRPGRAVLHSHWRHFNGRKRESAPPVAAAAGLDAGFHLQIFGFRLRGLAGFCAGLGSVHVRCS